MLDPEHSYNSNLYSEQTELQNKGGKFHLKGPGRPSNRLSRQYYAMQRTFLQVLQKTVRLNASQRYEWSFGPLNIPCGL